MYGKRTQDGGLFSVSMGPTMITGYFTGYIQNLIYHVKWNNWFRWRMDEEHSALSSLLQNYHSGS